MGYRTIPSTERCIRTFCMPKVSYCVFYLRQTFLLLQLKQSHIAVPMHLAILQCTSPIVGCCRPSGKRFGSCFQCLNYVVSMLPALLLASRIRTHCLAVSPLQLRAYSLCCIVEYIKTFLFLFDASTFVRHVSLS